MAALDMDDVLDDALETQRPLPRQPLTTPREAVSYAAAHLVRITLIFALSLTGALGPLYQWAFRVGGPTALPLLGFAFGMIWAALTLPLFVLARKFIGQIPLAALPPDQYPAMTWSRAEIGAYTLAHLIGVVIVVAFTSTVLAPIYATLYHQGQPAVSVALALVVALASTLMMFTLFVYSRRAFTRDTHAAGEDHRIGHDTVWVVDRPDLVGVRGWLLFFCVCLTILVPAIALINITLTIVQWPASQVLGHYPGLPVALCLGIIVRLGLTGVAFVAGYGLWRIRPGAVALTKNYLIAQLIAAVVLPFIEGLLAGLPRSAGTVLAIEGAKGFVVSLIGFLIGFVYLNRSVRVRMTYGRQQVETSAV